MDDIELVDDYPKHPLLYEEAILEPYRGSGKLFLFAGWEFKDTGLKPDRRGTPCGQILCYKPLPNPESLGAYLSYKTYGRCVSREDAAAWLIAHWYEHLLKICECLGARRSGFRTAMIDTFRHLHGSVVQSDRARVS